MYLNVVLAGLLLHCYFVMLCAADDRPQTSEPRASEKGDVDVTATPTQTISSHSLPVTSPSSSMAQASAGQMHGKTQNRLEHTAVGQTQRKTQNRSEQTALGQSQRKTQNSSEQTAVGQNQQTNQDTSKQILMARNAGKIQEKAEQKQPSADGVELQLAEGLGKGGKTKAQLKAERRAVQVTTLTLRGLDIKLVHTSHVQFVSVCWANLFLIHQSKGTVDTGLVITIKVMSWWEVCLLDCVAMS